MELDLQDKVQKLVGKEEIAQEPILVLDQEMVVVEEWGVVEEVDVDAEIAKTAFDKAINYLLPYHTDPWCSG